MGDIEKQEEESRNYPVWELGDILSFIHSLNMYLLSTCSVQGILLDIRDTTEKKLFVHESLLYR